MSEEINEEVVENLGQEAIEEPEAEEPETDETETEEEETEEEETGEFDAKYDLNNPEVTQRIQKTVTDMILQNIEAQRQQQTQQTQHETQQTQYGDSRFGDGQTPLTVKDLEAYDQRKQALQYQQMVEQQKTYYNTILNDYSSNHLSKITKGLSPEQASHIELNYYKAINEVEANGGQVSPALAQAIIAKHQGFVNNYLGNKTQVKSKFKADIDKPVAKGAQKKEAKPISSLTEALRVINQK